MYISQKILHSSWYSHTIRTEVNNGGASLQCDHPFFRNFNNHTCINNAWIFTSDHNPRLTHSTEKTTSHLGYLVGITNVIHSKKPFIFSPWILYLRKEHWHSPSCSTEKSTHPCLLTFSYIPVLICQWIPLSLSSQKTFSPTADILVKATDSSPHTGLSTSTVPLRQFSTVEWFSLNMTLFYAKPSRSFQHS